MDDVTPEEKRVIDALHRIAKIWPKSLYLFSGGGSLEVMRFRNDGSMAINESTGCADPSASIATIAIPNDGGGW